MVTHLALIPPEASPMSSPEDAPPPDAPRPDGPREVRLTQVIPDELAQGEYSNVATIIVGPAEFFLDFARIVPGRTEMRVVSRVILSPIHAKQLAMALSDNIRRYEQQHGQIPLPPAPSPGKAGPFH